MNRFKALAERGRSDPGSLTPDEITEVCGFALSQYDHLDRLASLPDADKPDAVKVILSRRGHQGLR